MLLLQLKKIIRFRFGNYKLFVFIINLALGLETRCYSIWKCHIQVVQRNYTHIMFSFTLLKCINYKFPTLTRKLLNDKFTTVSFIQSGSMLGR